MNSRAYLLVGVTDDMDQKQFYRAIKELEEIQGVDFVEHVVGSKDLVVLIEAPASVEALTNKVKENAWVKSIETLRIVSIHERHRSTGRLLRSLDYDSAKAFRRVQ